MSDGWGRMPGDEPTNAAGTAGFNPPSGPMGTLITPQVPSALTDLNKSLGQLISQLADLKTTMASFSQNQHQMGQGVVNTFNSVTNSASGASDAVKTFFTSLTGARPGGTAFGTALNYGLESGFAQDLAMFPLRYIQSTVGQNRNFSLGVGGALAGQQFATGIPTVSTTGYGGRIGRTGMFQALANTYGGGRAGLPTGSGEEITQFLQLARQAGAMTDLESLSASGTYGGNPRARGFNQSAYAMQAMYPGMPLGQIGQTLGGYVANSAAQRQSVMLTGGAFSMIGTGGKMKTIEGWSESILRWLENQRPGGKRGQPFSYGELITQQYPGSNISAWFDANSVPPDMQEVWWNYALAKARVRGDTKTGGAFDVTPESGVTGNVLNPARQRLSSTQPLTRTSFSLAQSLGGQYASREQANRQFNQLIGTVQQQIIPATLAGPLGFMQNLADPLEELLMSILERTGIVGATLGGTIGYGSLALGGGGAMLSNLLGPGGLLFSGLEKAMPGGLSTEMMDWFSKLIEDFGHGDVGDVGDWGPRGATSPNSLHPSMNSKVSAMMKANPRLRVNSGRRDEHTQRKLKSQGYSRVSGKSSAHTRGLAADMGPSSEYPWLVANAAKFGLSSGVSHGEPWHVGMPGIGDDPNSMGLGALLGLLGGSGADALSTIGGALPGLFSLLFGQGVSNKMTASDIEKNLAYDPEYTKKFYTASNYTLGGKYGGGQEDFFQKILAAAQTRAGKTTANDIPGNQGGTGSESLVGALQALGISSTGLSDGAMVALLANKAGWTGTDLVASVAISKRESGFSPIAHRTDVDPALMRGDRGLWQINAGAWNDWLKSNGYIKDPLDRAIFDPWVNAQAAHGIYARSGNFSAWTMGPNGWDPNGDPFYGTNRNEAEGYVREAGLATSIGDVDNAPSSSYVAAMRGGGALHFHNTFNVGGGGNSGMDVRRMVNLIADQLEGEMRRRMARSN